MRKGRKPMRADQFHQWHVGDREPVHPVSQITRAPRFGYPPGPLGHFRNEPASTRMCWPVM
jgi:hypothetical protein